MFIGSIFAQSIGLTLATAGVGIVLCSSFWELFKLIDHPEWGPALVAIPIVFAVAGWLPDSEFLRRVVVFIAAFAGPFWVAGIAWRTRSCDRANRVRQMAYERSDDGLGNVTAGVRPGGSDKRYPVIVACIGEDRHPSPSELKRVAARILHEAFRMRYSTPGITERRDALRAARRALRGS